MGYITFRQIATAIANTFKGMPSPIQVQGPAELTESIPDLPLIQVYPEEGQSLPQGGERTSFKAVIRQHQMSFNIDIYACNRSSIGADLIKGIDLLDEAQAILERQSEGPLFGLEGIRGFEWTWERVTFEYDVSKYVGYRIRLTLRTF